MGQRCTIGQHGSCCSCGYFVAPTQREHAHIANVSGGTYEIVCNRCWIALNLAALPILSSINSAGLPCANNQDLKNIIANRVIIAIQTGLDESEASRN